MMVLIGRIRVGRRDLVGEGEEETRDKYMW